MRSTIIACVFACVFACVTPALADGFGYQDNYNNGSSDGFGYQSQQQEPEYMGRYDYQQPCCVYPETPGTFANPGE